MTGKFGSGACFWTHIWQCSGILSVSVLKNHFQGAKGSNPGWPPARQMPPLLYYGFGLTANSFSSICTSPVTGEERNRGSFETQSEPGFFFYLRAWLGIILTFRILGEEWKGITVIYGVPAVSDMLWFQIIHAMCGLTSYGLNKVSAGPAYTLTCPHPLHLYVVT